MYNFIVSPINLDFLTSDKGETCSPGDSANASTCYFTNGLLLQNLGILSALDKVLKSVNQLLTAKMIFYSGQRQAEKNG